MVTLFTAVVYYRADDGELNHQSYVRVSNEQSQGDKASDYAFNKAILERVKEITPVKVVHYWSDGAGSQFKNQYLSRLLYHEEHPSLFPSICQRTLLCICQQYSMQKIYTVNRVICCLLHKFIVLFKHQQNPGMSFFCSCGVPFTLLKSLCASSSSPLSIQVVGEIPWSSSRVAVWLLLLTPTYASLCFLWHDCTSLYMTYNMKRISLFHKEYLHLVVYNILCLHAVQVLSNSAHVAVADQASQHIAPTETQKNLTFTDEIRIENSIFQLVFTVMPWLLFPLSNHNILFL